MKLPQIALLLACCVVGGCGAEHQAPPSSNANVTAEKTLTASDSASADQALDLLMAGNKRFIAGQPIHPHDNTQRRGELTGSQHPFAIILGCSDSRVPPPLIFDAGLGDIFEIRIAGNSADAAVTASIEYAVEHLHAPLLVVLGHEKCGAVGATIDAMRENKTPPAHLAAIVDPIRSAVEKAKSEPGDLTSNAVAENVKQVVTELQHSEPVLAESIHSGKLRIVGAVYHLDTGQVVLVEGNATHQ